MTTNEGGTDDQATLAKLGDHLASLRLLINATPDIICFKDGRGRWLEANDADLALFDLQDVDYRGKTDADLAELSSFHRGAFLACIDTDEAAWQRGVLSRGVEEISQSDGVVRVFDVIKVPVFRDDGSRRGLVVFGRDITEQRIAEDKLIRAQKLEALGLLAGGVAHDFNNQLTVLSLTLHLARVAAAKGLDASAHFDAANQAVERSRALSHQLLTFASRRRGSRENVDVRAIIEQCAQLMERIKEDAIEIDLQLPSEPVYVFADPVRLEQLIMNLAINARDALEGKGRLSIALSADDETAILTVADDGVGMDAETIARVFDPFFTTKATKGTGLGLAIVADVAASLDGAVAVESDPGAGTRFEVKLPRRRDVTPAQVEEAEVVEGQTGTLLLVEDNALVLRSLAELLRSVGHTVFEASAPEQALQLLTSKGPEVDLVLTDLDMPGLSGMELAEAMRLQVPDLQVLFMSGHRSRDVPAADFLAKPLVPETLLRTISSRLKAKI